ncbi:MAG: hypothetical protein HZC55_04795 [Verrucomicrobia bacterium]|nr:hypothetical protein [Verrucomicrobiota bacterium]
MSKVVPRAVERAAPEESGWTRRRFVRESAGALAAMGWAGRGGAAPAAAAAPGAQTVARKRYRAVSWWLVFDDLQWPNDELRDAIRRRADRCAESAVNCCLIFGAHFRWDFLPLWSRLHDLLATIATELHERKILLFDHHSSVLTHRPRNVEEARGIWQRNRHHVPFYPSAEVAATWTYEGAHLDDWRMWDVESGRPVYLPVYAAEQYCMNHPGFRAAYGRYVRELVAATGIDGLMSDDGIYYADWRACGCPHCRERFRREYGHALPPVSDAGFWGNRRSAAFRDWIEMRYRSSRDFLGTVREALPAGFPLLTCCASSDGHALPAYGMSYQDFIRHCDHIVLEMVGSTPVPAGTWDGRIPSQLLHLGLARTHRVPCLGLGYGFFPDTAFFIWALNKFLGSDCWFSTLKGRLGASAAQLATLADDAELVGEGYRWERAHPGLFEGEADTEVAVFFSRATRDYYGQVAADYVGDYHATCLALMRAGVSCEVVTEIPPAGRFRRLVLSSAVCLAADERRALADFLAAGGTVLATGPCGFLDGRAGEAHPGWLSELGVAAEWDDPPRPGGFPPYQQLRAPVAVATCRAGPGDVGAGPDGWHQVVRGAGRVWWRPERMARKETAAAVLQRLGSGAAVGADVQGWPGGWQARRFRDGHRRLIHSLPAQVATVLHPELKNQIGQQPVIERLVFTPLHGDLVVAPVPGRSGVVLHSPDLADSRPAVRGSDGAWRVSLEGVRRYFVLEIEGAAPA